MKKTVFLALGFSLLILANAYAADQAVEVPNKICPVSHEEVGKEGMAAHKVTYKGKAYNLCCSMCEKDFNKDPDKYVKMMEEEVAQQKESAAKSM
jgi:YHS domain-containing protein